MTSDRKATLAQAPEKLKDGEISIQHLRKGSLRSTDSQVILGTRHTLADVDTPPSHDDAKSMSRVATFVSFLLMKAAEAGMKIR